MQVLVNATLLVINSTTRYIPPKFVVFNSLATNANATHHSNAIGIFYKLSRNREIKRAMVFSKKCVFRSGI